MAEYETLRVEQDGSLVWIVFARPSEGNRFDAPQWRELESVLDRFKQDDGVRVLILRGDGHCFSTGIGYQFIPPQTIDGREIPGEILADHHVLASTMQRYLRLWDYPKPIIAAVHGECLQTAATLCVFCDITVVADDAIIGRLPKLALGGGYHVPVWSWLIGPKRAKQMEYVEGDQISGKLAAEWGWANYSVPEDQLFDNVKALAQNIARVPAPMLRLKKLAHNHVLELQGFRLAVTMGAEIDNILHYSRDAFEYRATVQRHGWDEAYKRHLPSEPTGG